eukprot:SAG22_NODE_13598_length_401_cov_0.509934_1_plen_61_part_10
MKIDAALAKHTVGRNGQGAVQPAAAADAEARAAAAKAATISALASFPGGSGRPGGGSVRQP